MNLIGSVAKLLGKHGGKIFTALSVTGVVGTVVLVAKESPEAVKKLERADSEKYEEWKTRNDIQEWEEYPGLTLGEKAEIVAPIFLPSILAGLSTIGFIVGGQIFNSRQQALLAATNGILAEEFYRYRTAIKSEYGDDADKRAMDICRMKNEKLKQQLEELKKIHGPFLYTFATLPGVVIESTPKDITNAFLHFDRNLVLAGENNLHELYKFVGIPESLYNIDDALEFGWDTYENEISWGGSIGAFRVEHIGTVGYTPLYLIDFSITPYKLGLDYGAEDDSIDNLFPGYSPESAKSLALQSGKEDAVVVDPPYISVQGFT